MKGFALGMVLIAVYVAVQDSTAARVEQAGGVFGGAVRRLLSPGVAGVPQRGTSAGARVGQAAGQAVSSPGIGAGAGVGGAITSPGVTIGGTVGQVAGQVAGQLG